MCFLLVFKGNQRLYDGEHDRRYPLSCQSESVYWCSKVVPEKRSVRGWPARRFNELELRWTASETWVFERLFNVSASMMSQDKLDIILTGVDTAADIYIDNTLLRSVYNAHRCASLPITSLESASSPICQS